jgi:hypothetical protein
MWLRPLIGSVKVHTANLQSWLVASQFLSPSPSPAQANREHPGFKQEDENAARNVKHSKIDRGSRIPHRNVLVVPYRRPVEY